MLRFAWRYSDRRGEVAGDGVARYNPPDSLRLDLFTSGDVAMAVALASGQLRVQGEIDDIEIPRLPFVYAMAGLFESAPGEPEGYRNGEDSVLVYAPDAVARDYYFVRDGRLRRVEERRRGRTVRRVNVEWGAKGRWPLEAEYRDLEAHSRVRWEMGRITSETESHPARIYDLPPVP